MSQEKILVSNLRGVVLTCSEEQLLRSKELKRMAGLRTIGLTLPGSERGLKERITPYLGHPLTEEGLKNLKNGILGYYTSHYHPLVRIQVPNQEITEGILQLVVLESLLSEVKIEGKPHWGSLAQVQDAIQLEQGAPIDTQILMADLNFLNRNPYRHVDAIFQPGQKENTTDLLLLVEERPRSYQFYAGAQDSGIKITKEQLYLAGFNLFNCFFLGHLLSYQYTTSNFHAMQAHTAQYMAPLPNRQIVNLFGGYSSFYPIQSYPVQSSQGYSAQASLRYVIPLLPTFSLKSEVTAGFDFKGTNTDIGYSPDTQLVPFHQNVYLTQWMASYNGSFQKSSSAVDFLAEVYFSPLEWLPDQSDADFSALRPGARNRWIYARGALFYYQDLPREFYLSLSMRGQWSSAPLLPSEQFGLGGYDTVRGYAERTLNFDNAVLFSGEIHTPTWSLIRRAWKRSGLSDGLQLLAFVDYGRGTNNIAVPGEGKTGYLLGVGPGARYTLGEFLTCRIDWGLKLHKNPVVGESLGYIHFSVMASY